jgi:hypothetical protein
MRTVSTTHTASSPTDLELDRPTQLLAQTAGAIPLDAVPRCTLLNRCAHLPVFHITLSFKWCVISATSAANA